MKDITRVLIETTLRKALKDMKDSPARSARNLIDLGLAFAKGRFQKHFLKTTSEMFRNKQSRYYDLIQDVVLNVDIEKLITFGVNIGYNSCTLGAKIIRDIEKNEGFNIPWSLHLEINGDKFTENTEQYKSVIKQGEELGIYTWFVFMSGNSKNVFTLCSDYPDSAYILFLSANEITEEFLDEAEKHDNLLIVVEYSDDAIKACMQIRKRKLLYSVYATLSEKDIDFLTNGELFCCTEAIYPIFTAIICDSSCAESVRNKVYEYVIKTRESQGYHTIPWDIIHDNRYIDGIISEDDCSVAFNETGQLVSVSGGTVTNTCNIFENKLKDILCLNFNKNHKK